MRENLHPYFHRLSFLEELDNRDKDDRDNILFEDLEVLPELLAKRDAMHKMQQQEEVNLEAYKDLIGYGAKKRALERTKQKLRDTEPAAEQDDSQPPPLYERYSGVKVKVCTSGPLNVILSICL